jgi:hypothetical protein
MLLRERGSSRSPDGVSTGTLLTESLHAIGSCRQGTTDQEE